MKVHIFFLSVILFSCSSEPAPVRNMEEDPSQTEVNDTLSRETGFVVSYIAPVIEEGAKGVKVWITVANVTTKPIDSALHTELSVVNKDKKTSIAKVEGNLNPENSAIAPGSYFENYLYAALPDSILAKGGEMYLDIRINGIKLKRIRYVYLLFTKVSPREEMPFLYIKKAEIQRG